MRAGCVRLTQVKGQFASLCRVEAEEAVPKFLVAVQEEKPMKSLLSLLALGIAVATITPAYAEAPATEAECNKTPDMEWDDSQGKCVEQSPGG
jgi:ribosomal protein L12E/L44/L45/RPP1/RPP2